MAAVSRLGKQLSELISALSTAGAPFALIGGLALAPYKVVRATQDIDLLTDSRMAETIHQALLDLGYECLHRSTDAGNYQRHDERVDLIYAHRPAAMRLLASAGPRQTPFGQLNVVSAEGLIGLKLQAYVNNARRTQDLEDIRALLAANRDALDMEEVRADFRLFDKEPTPAAGARWMSSDPRTQPLVNDVRVARDAPRVPEDPFAALDDLMCVVEEFCPRWPDRPTFEGSAVYLL